MRIASIALAAAAMLSLSAATQVASAQTSSAQPSATQASFERTDSASSGIICHKDVHEGMVLSSGNCGSAEQWARIRRQNEQAVREYQLRAQLSHPVK